MILALAAAAVTAVVLIAAGAGAFSGSGPAPAQPGRSSARSDGGDLGPAGDSARSFLRSWVDDDGRVVRRDQGGDTVSEGQAYGLLLAVSEDDHIMFDRIWTWTRQHLQQPGGSLAWRWEGGRIVDGNPATDADLDAVHALQLAADGWHRPDLAGAARRIAAATLRESTVRVREGRLLAAGPWAVGDGSATTHLDPSYLVPGEARRLAETTGQSGWRDVERATAVMDRTLVSDGHLPPDWAELPQDASSAAQVRPAVTPATKHAVVYGLDAPRLLIRLASSCTKADRRLAANAPDSATALDAPALRSLDGTATVTWRHPVTDIAGAAVLVARGDEGAARVALRTAAREQDDSRTYYGAAWLALGASQLFDHRLGSCAGVST